jgi:hypothetical protein
MHLANNLKARTLVRFSCPRFVANLLLVVLPGFLSAQEITKDNFHAIVKWAPLTLLTPETPTMQLGAELLFPKFTKYGVGVELNYGFRGSMSRSAHPYNLPTLFTPQMDPPNYYDKCYGKYRLEIRKYIWSRKIINLYVGVEGFYIPYTYQVAQGQYVGLDGEEYVFDNAHVHKDIKGGDLKFGCALRFKFRVTVEGFVGIGMRIVNRTYSDFTNRQVYNGSNTKYDKYTENTVNEGEERLFHLALGIKIGYRIF